MFSIQTVFLIHQQLVTTVTMCLPAKLILITDHRQKTILGCAKACAINSTGLGLAISSLFG